MNSDRKVTAISFAVATLLLSPTSFAQEDFINGENTEIASFWPGPGSNNDLSCRGTQPRCPNEKVSVCENGQWTVCTPRKAL